MSMYVTIMKQGEVRVHGKSAEHDSLNFVARSRNWTEESVLKPFWICRNRLTPTHCVDNGLLSPGKKQGGFL